MSTDKEKAQEIDTPLTEGKVREMIPDLEWDRIDETPYYLAITPIGDYVVSNEVASFEVNDEVIWYATVPSIQDARKACQRDYEDRVLRALGFETKNKDQ